MNRSEYSDKREAYTQKMCNVIGIGDSVTLMWGHSSVSHMPTYNPPLTVGPEGCRETGIMILQSRSL